LCQPQIIAQLFLVQPVDAILQLAGGFLHEGEDNYVARSHITRSRQDIDDALS